MKAEKLVNDFSSVEEADSFQSVTRLIAMNAMIEAARMGKEGKQFAHLTQQMIDLARDASADDELMSDMIEKQIQSIQNMSSEAK